MLGLADPNNHLQRQLNQFGLNPNDWEMAALTTEDYLVVHRKDSEVKLLGKTQQSASGLVWKDLALLELMTDQALPE